MAKAISKERLAIAEQCLDDGWSFWQITQTHRISAKTLRRHFPGRGMDVKEAAKVGYAAMKASKAMNTFCHVNRM
jgi:hypothetical protein